MDFASELQRIQRRLQQQEYTPAATRCMIVTEQALRAIAERYSDRINAAVKQKVDEAVRKRGKRRSDQLTMGQLVRVFEEAGFMEACARIAGKDLSSLAIIEIKRLIELRNKLIHHAQEASQTEAEFLNLCLKVLLETFELFISQSKGPKSPADDMLFRDGHALIIGVGADLPDTVNINGILGMDVLTVAHALIDSEEFNYKFFSLIQVLSLGSVLKKWRQRFDAFFYTSTTVAPAFSRKLFSFSGMPSSVMT